VSPIDLNHIAAAPRFLDIDGRRRELTDITSSQVPG
jgi:hypothetical protein